MIYSISYFLWNKSEPPFFSLSFVVFFPLLIKLPMPSGVRALGHPIWRGFISSPKPWEVLIVSDPRRG